MNSPVIALGAPSADLVQAPMSWNVSAQLDILQPHVEARIRAWIDTLPKKPLYHTRRVYNNGDIQDNVVLAEDLANHVEYNLVFRFGCALFVHGFCVGTGYLNAQKLQAIYDRLSTDPKVCVKSTSPYS